MIDFLPITSGGSGMALSYAKRNLLFFPVFLVAMPPAAGRNGCLGRINYQTINAYLYEKKLPGRTFLAHQTGRRLLFCTKGLREVSRRLDCVGEAATACLGTTAPTSSRKCSRA